MPELRLRLEHARRGDLQVVVLRQRGAQQRLELLVLKHVPPVRIGERRAGGRRLSAADSVSVHGSVAGLT